MYIVGDIQGGDTICGHIVHYEDATKKILSSCDAGPNKLSNRKVGTCKRLKMKDIMSLVSEADVDALNESYQVPHYVAWFDLDYGGNPKGIFTATCLPEALHALENGIYFLVLKQ